MVTVILWAGSLRITMTLKLEKLLNGNIKKINKTSIRSNVVSLLDDHGYLGAFYIKNTQLLVRLSMKKTAEHFCR